MEDDETQKAIDFVSNELKDALRETLGAPVTMDTLDNAKASIQKFFDKLSKDQGVGVSEVSVEAAGFIKYKLQQPSLMEQILPTMKGPFMTWEEEGVVHVAGRLGNYEVRICDWKQLSPGGYGCPGMMITCLGCLTNQHATNL